MTRPKIFVTRSIPDQGLALIRDACDVDLWPAELPPPCTALIEHVRGVDGLLCLLTDPIDAAVMDAAGTGLRVISNHAVGFDNIDVAAATARGIPVGNTPGILTDATADFAFALLMAAARRVAEGERFVRAGRWRTWGPSLLLGPDVHGATLGIIGFGRIGQAVARRAAGFEMRVLYFDPTAPVADPALRAEAVDLETLLGESDFVSLHVPLTPQTRGLLDRETLALMKPSAILINTARGPVIDPDALYEALREHRIFAAALDVTDPEPIPPDSPLLTLDNCLIVPHIASASIATRRKMSLMAAQNLIAGLQDEPLPNCVNPEAYRESPISRN